MDSRYAVNDLKHHFEAKLNLVARIAGLSHGAEVRRIEVPHWNSKIGMVEKVKNLTPELQPQTFSDGEVPEKTQIQILNTIRPQNIASGIAVGIGSRRLSDTERRGAEPFRGRGIRQNWISDHPGPVGRSCIRNVRRSSD